MNKTIKTTVKAEVESNNGEILIHINPADLKEHFSSQLQLKELLPGDVAKIGDSELIVLEHRDCGTAVLFKNLLSQSMKFDDDTCNFAKSSIRKFLNEDFLKDFAKVVGEENIIPHVVDLTTDDGLECHGDVKANISLLTTDLYRKYRKVIGDNMEHWWWTATAWSDENETSCVRCVFYDGLLGRDFCYYCGGVRPFCILNSEIFVSK